MNDQGDLFADPQPVPIRHGAHETEIEAAVRAAGNAGTIRRKVYEAIRANPPGLTDEEINKIVADNPSSSTPRARRIGLARDGMLAPTGLTRRTSAGNHTIVWGIKMWVPPPCGHGTEYLSCPRCQRRKRLNELP